VLLSDFVWEEISNYDNSEQGVQSLAKQWLLVLGRVHAAPGHGKTYNELHRAFQYSAIVAESLASATKFWKSWTDTENEYGTEHSLKRG
jgi:hypothetical protein